MVFIYGIMFIIVYCLRSYIVLLEIGYYVYMLKVNKYNVL